MGSSSNFGKEFGGKVTSVGSLIANILGSFISIVVFLVLLSVSLVLLVNYNKIDLSLHWIQASNWEKKHAYWGPGHFVSVGNFGTCAYIYERG